ncbi:hypothetical protein [Streptomyces sp. Je 1-369]|uniref:hypothetical protein n=1 Tax=Streptomyces sp. Je 1-369 TaxID=2966192 RepID=UPI002286A6DA|nr:hypothetical protein [Streptomyces sp. Je 1-369]WAL99310.1 hypothetical protein NOO62_35460 [Streptomyces sp. Je 1-369]
MAWFWGNDEDGTYEDAQSRAWLGVRFPWDAEDGLVLGDRIADHVHTSTLRKL